MIQRIITGMIPPGGWHFMQEGKHRIESDSYDHLIEAVQTWRLQNQRPVGNVVQDVIDYICSNFPRQCQGTPEQRASGAVKPTPGAGNKFVDKIIQWANDARDEGIARELETEQEALRRANICAQCPKNSTWENSCPSCVDHAQRLMAILRQGKDIQSMAPRLHGCSEVTHDNRTAIWIKKEFLRKSDGMPEACWVTK